MSIVLIFVDTILILDPLKNKKFRSNAYQLIVELKRTCVCAKK